MLKAGALPYAILITLLITIVCAMLTGVHYIYSKLYNKEELTIKINDNIESGMNVVLCRPDLFEYKDNQSLDLFEDSTDKVLVSKKIWGGFELIKIKTQIGKTKAEKIALIGSALGPDSTTALYMLNQNNYLYVAGNTKIKGNCWVPGGYVKAGYIEGKQYTGKTIIEGTTFQSGTALPEINKEVVSNFNNYLNNPVETDSILPYDKIADTQISIHNSFEQKTILINAEAKILLSNCKLSGNIIVRSGNTVEIDSSAKLQDIIIYAPKIKIYPSFTGSIQLIARDSVVIEKACKLKYPSFVGIVGKTQTLIVIKEGALVQGAVFLLQSDNADNKRSKITIHKNSQIQGIVYSDAGTEIMGKVSGPVFCKNFVLQVKSSFYENYLLDAEINIEELPKFYVGAVLFKNNRNRKLIGWLN